MTVFYEWENVDSTLFATRGQILDLGFSLPDDIEYVHTIRTHRSLIEFKLYEVSMAQRLPKMDQDMFNKILGYKQLLNAIYVINNRAKNISEYIEENKMDNSQKSKISKWKEEKIDLYRMKEDALKYLYGENRIDLIGYHTIGTDKRKSYLFERHPYSFHNWAETFNVFTNNYLGHLDKYPKGEPKDKFYGIDAAKGLLNEYTNKYINNEKV
ncbi:hypothetical protein ACFVP8_08040 [Viridibacillus arvi]|uniref:hypothetical protein n=1 Tax=Viridibacillus arvi TaxID=263475 RepID=UPI00368246A2